MLNNYAKNYLAIVEQKQIQHENVHHDELTI